MQTSNWKRKLTSRKFWAALLAVATSVMTIWQTSAETQDAVVALGWAVAALIAYIVGEGLVDAAGALASGDKTTADTGETAETAGTTQADQEEAQP